MLSNWSHCFHSIHLVCIHNARNKMILIMKENDPFTRPSYLAPFWKRKPSTLTVACKVLCPLAPHHLARLSSSPFSSLPPPRSSSSPFISSVPDSYTPEPLLLLLPPLELPSLAHRRAGSFMLRRFYADISSEDSPRAPWHRISTLRLCFHTAKG